MIVVFPSRVIKRLGHSDIDSSHYETPLLKLLVAKYDVGHDDLDSGHCEQFLVMETTFNMVCCRVKMIYYTPTKYAMITT